MVKGTAFAKYRGERSTELALSCYITRHSVSAVLYDMELSRRYARAVSYGSIMTSADAAEPVALTIQRAMRGSGTPGNVVKRVGFAAPPDITMTIEEQLTPGDLFLSPDTEMLVMPMMNSVLGGDFTAALASAVSDGRNVLAADVSGSLRLASCRGSAVKYAHIPMAGGFDGSAIESGMPLEQGAVETLRRENDGTISYSVIGDGDSAGISVPAALSAVNLMLDGGALDSDGIMTDRDLFYIGEDLYVSQADVRALQSDKASCRAALELFGRETGRAERVVISGEALGSEHGAAMTAQLGAVPRGLADRYGWSRCPGEQGLISCLVSPERLAEIHEMCAHAEDVTEHILGQFNDLYINNLGFAAKL